MLGSWAVTAATLGYQRNGVGSISVDDGVAAGTCLMWTGCFAVELNVARSLHLAPNHVGERHRHFHFQPSVRLALFSFWRKSLILFCHIISFVIIHAGTCSRRVTEGKHPSGLIHERRQLSRPSPIPAVTQTFVPILAALSFTAAQRSPPAHIGSKAA